MSRTTGSGVWIRAISCGSTPSQASRLTLVKPACSTAFTSGWWPYQNHTLSKLSKSCCTDALHRLRPRETARRKPCAAALADSMSARADDCGGGDEDDAGRLLPLMATAADEGGCVGEWASDAEGWERRVCISCSMIRKLTSAHACHPL